MEKCTNPDAPFYSADLVILSMLETFGVDMPCTAMLTTGTTVLSIVLMAPILGMALACQGRI